MIVEAFEDGLEWLNIRSYTQRVSTISFTYEVSQRSAMPMYDYFG